MNLKKVEIILLLIIAILICAIILKRQDKKKQNHYLVVVLAVIILIEGFVGIHFIFCYQINPVSVSQDNGTDMNLNSSDWLEFLGSYLGFAGSLIMAYLVYYQSKTIDEFTIAEYKPSLSIVNCTSIKSSECGEWFKENNLIQYLPDKLNEPYYTYHCEHSKVAGIQYEKFNILVFVEILNNSKSVIENCSFLNIEIKQIDDNNIGYKYTILSEQWDPADKKTSISAGGRLKRCFLIKDIPNIIGISWFRISFKYGKDQHYDMEVLVSKQEGEALTFLDILH